MERVANNLVSETPVREGAALEELNAFLDLQVKLIFEALDERIAARNTKRDALCAQSSARPSGGSGVLDAAVAQEVIPDLNLAAAVTSATSAEPSDINIYAPPSCSTKFPSLVIDAPALVPVCTVTAEVIPELDHVADATSPIYAKPGDIDISAITRCLTKCPSHTCEFMASAAVEELFADHVGTTATMSDSTSSCIGAPFTTSASNTFAMSSSFKLLLEEMRQMELRLGRKLDAQYQIPSATATSAIDIFNVVNLDKEPVFNKGPVFDEEPTVFDKGPIFDEELNVLDDGPVFDEEPTVFDEGPIFDDGPVFDVDLFDGEEHAATRTFNKEVIPDIGLAAVYAIAEEPVTEPARGAVTCVGNNMAVQPVDAPNTMDLDINHGHGYTAIAVLHIEGLFKDVPAPMEAAKVSPPKLSFGNELDTPLPGKCSIACLDHVIDVQASASTVSDAMDFLHPEIMLYDWAIPWVLPVKCVDWQLWPPPMSLELTHDGVALRPIPWPSFILSNGCYMSWDFSFIWKPPWPHQFRQNIRSVPPTILHELLKCIGVSSVCVGCAEVELTSGNKLELHLVDELIFGADEIYIQSSRGVVVMLSGMIWLLEHSIDLFKKLVELILWPSIVLMHVLGFGVKLRPIPWSYCICEQSFVVFMLQSEFMLKSESPGSLLTTKGSMCVVMSVLTTWARTKAISYSSHDTAWRLGIMHSFPISICVN